jgi:hypothetical protein
MDHFEPITPELRWKNELLREQKRTNELLEHIAQMLQVDKSGVLKQERKTRVKRT